MTSPRWLRHPLTFWLIWHTLALSAFFAIIGLREGIPPWRFGRADLVRATVLAIGYLLGAALLHGLAFRGRTLRFGEVLLGAFAGFGLVFFSFLTADIQISRFALALAFVAGVVLLLVGFLITRYRGLMLGTLALGVFGVMVWTARSGAALATLPRGRSVSTLATSLHPTRASVNRNYLPRTTSHFSGGGITSFGPGHLIVTSDGNLLTVRWDAAGVPQVERVRQRVPLNRDEFAAVAGAGSYVNWFRAFDVLAREENGRLLVLVSHHFWKAEQRCFVVRVSLLQGEVPDRLTDSAWKTVHETRPCLPLVVAEPSWPFRGMEGGGRMAFVDADHLLLTVGDQGFNGVDFESEPDLVQDSTASYGKTVLVDLRDGSWKPYTIGHRNPQGLLVDREGIVWLTEHGPQGGDELNRLTPGANYGWPAVTYGTDYGKNAWPRNPRQGHHEGFTQPVFAWVPSIGASNLIQVRGDLFVGWAGDLLIGTLLNEALLRVRIDSGHVRLVERIPVGDRVRDLVEDPDGRIILLTDSYGLVVLEPTQMAFTMCAGCHSTSGVPGSGLGPDLAGILGRPIASQAGFRYSDALRSVGGSWDVERLDRFLADPQAFAPGTSMTMQGIGDSTSRRRIIQYLQER